MVAEKERAALVARSSSESVEEKAERGGRAKQSERRGTTSKQGRKTIEIYADSS